MPELFHFERSIKEHEKPEDNKLPAFVRDGIKLDKPTSVLKGRCSCKKGLVYEMPDGLLFCHSCQHPSIFIKNKI